MTVREHGGKPSPRRAAPPVTYADTARGVLNAPEVPPERHPSVLGRAVTRLRGAMFVAATLTYFAVFMEPAQRLVLGPLVRLRPDRRRDMLRRWLMAHAKGIVNGARHVAGLDLVVKGAIPDEPCILVMNHQSVFDIPLAISLVSGPYPRLPVRQKYMRGIPGLSPLMRMLGCIPLSQQKIASRRELEALMDAADGVARGETSLLIYPEGHRSPDGELQPFMKSGLRLILGRARGRHVYLGVVDGLWQFRTFSETALRLGGARATVEVLGPYTIPEGKRELESFISELEERMRETLDSMRGTVRSDATRDGPAGA